MTTPQSTKKPHAWMYYGWYALLMLWMQGNALLHSILVFMALVSLPYYPGALRRLAQFRYFAIAWAAYVGVRLLSTLQADHPLQAWIGMGDDLRMASFALLALIYIRTREDFIRSAWASFIGFAVLGWWALAYQLWSHGSLAPAGDVIFGALEHVNYAAAFSSVAMFAMFVAFIQLPLRQGWPLLLGIIPLAIMQLPLSSRTVLMVFAAGLTAYIVWQRSWRLLIASGLLAGIIGAGLVLTPGAIQQFGTFKQYKQQAEGKGGLPSLQIRIEIWKLLWHLSEHRHILGLGPRNAGYVDLNLDKAWIAANMPETLKTTWMLDPKWKGIETYDFNHAFGGHHPVTYDPHSQYAATISETGFLGLFALLALYLAAWRSTSRHQHTSLEGAASHTVLGLLWIYGISGITIPVMFQTGGIIFFIIITSTLALISCENREHPQSDSASVHASNP